VTHVLYKLRWELGPVDGFDQDQSASKCRESCEAVSGFLTPHLTTPLIFRSAQVLRRFVAISYQIEEV
jgi:hypothetical protein